MEKDLFLYFMYEQECEFKKNNLNEYNKEKRKWKMECNGALYML